MMTSSSTAISKVATSVWFPSAGAVELRREALPEVGSEDVRIEAIASGISAGTEMLVLRGQVPADLELDLPTLRGSFDFPIKYGYASVGSVTQTGVAVNSLARGDLVFALHPHQTCFVVPASFPIKLPTSIPPEHGVFLANIETAINIVLDAAPRIGERVAVFPGSPANIKITTQGDLMLAKAILQSRPAPKAKGPAHPFAEEEMWR